MRTRRPEQERDKDRLDVAALREIIAGETTAGPVDLVELTPPVEPPTEESG